MNFYKLELHKFILGEHRTDGWKSDWRKDLERRMAEDKLKPIVKRPKIEVKRVQSMKKKPNRFYFKRECSVCAEPIRQDNKTGRCIKHKLERPQPLEVAYACGACNKSIRKTTHGICKKCYIKYRRRIEQRNPRCAECGIVIRMSAKYGLCRKHCEPIYKKNEKLVRKMRRQELKKAA
jgi:hypothetical protein